MAKVGAQRAAELTGKSKSTIQRAMNSGKLSYELDGNGRRIIDVSELERVFGIKSTNDSQSTDTVEAELKKASDILETERLKMKVKMLEDKVDTMTEMIDDMKEQRDQWQKQAQQVLITSQYSQKQAENLQEEVKEFERREQERRRMAAEARMKRLNGENQNKKTAASSTRPMTGSANSSEGQSSGRGLDFQGLWKKIRGEGSAA